MLTKYLSFLKYNFNRKHLSDFADILSCDQRKLQKIEKNFYKKSSNFRFGAPSLI